MCLFSSLDCDFHSFSQYSNHQVPAMYSGYRDESNSVLAASAEAQSGFGIWSCETDRLHVWFLPNSGAGDFVSHSIDSVKIPLFMKFTRLLSCYEK